jgi:hypothetical protein
MQTPWHYTTVIDALDHWQSLVAGLLALLAAGFAVGGAEFFARLKEWREKKALRGSLAAEIRLYIELLIKTREILKTPAIETQFLVPGGQQSRQGDLRELAVLHPPTVYPAAADRMGFMKRPRAADVVEFYATIERLNFSTRAATTEPTKPVSVTNYEVLVSRFEEACVKTLPLLSQLPFHEGDAALEANIKRIDAEMHASPAFASRLQRGR